MIVDPITLEVLKHGFISVVEEMSTIIHRTAYSLNIRERVDYSTALIDAEGRLVAQAQRIPMHMGGMSRCVQVILATYACEAITPGDIFISNDPYNGCQHTPDVQLSAPIFFNGELVGFSCAVAHHLDLGGGSPSAMDYASQEIFQEGLIFPSLKLYEAGRQNDVLVRMIRANVRYPETAFGDLRAQIAAVTTGIRRFEALLDRWGPQTVFPCANELMDRSERGIRRSLASIPDGRYEFEDHIDASIVTGEPRRIRAAVTVRGDEIDIDFEGSAPEEPSALNATLTATRSAVFYAVRALCDPEIMQNEGCYRPVTVTAPLGTIVNPRPPTACGARITIAHRIVDVVFGALATVVPDRVETASYGGSPCYQMRGLKDDGASFIHFDCVHTSSGARLRHDGNDGATCKLHNSANVPIEATEAEEPLRFEAYEFIPDSAGAGAFRGGLSIRRSVRLLAPNAQYVVVADRERIAPYGLAGGHPGRKARCVLDPGTPGERVVGCKSKGTLLRDQVLCLEPAGAGGYGDPRQRDRHLLDRDVLDGVVTPEAAEREYGVRLEGNAR